MSLIVIYRILYVLDFNTTIATMSGDTH